MNSSENSVPKPPFDWSKHNTLDRKALQKAYEELDFLPEDNIYNVLSGLAHRFNISVDEVIKNIDL